MNWADYAIIVIVLLSVLVGLWRGLVTEVLALAIWIGAFWVAWMFGPRVAQALSGSIDEPSIRIILGYALCFVAVLILGALLRFAVARLIAGTGLSGTDRMLGMVFGLARGVFMVALLVFLLQFTRVTHDRWWHQSRLLPTFITAADWLGERVPNNVRQYLRTHGVTPGLDQKASTGGRPPASSATSHAGGNTRPGHAFAR